MNRQDMKTPKQAPRSTQTASAPHRKRPDPALLRALRGLMLIMMGVIALIGLLLIILPTFRVQSIEVEGNSYYTDEEIRVASGIEIGQELLAINNKDVENGIWNLKYVDSIKIVRSLTGVRIVVEENQTVMSVEFNGSYFSIDRNLCVLEQSQQPFSAFLSVTLPQIASLRVGAPLVFEDASTDLTYLNDLLDCLEEKGILSDVSSIDVSKKYGVSYVLMDSCRVELGKVSQMDTKLMLVDEILQRKGGADAAISIIDVTNLQKPTYRVLSTTQLSAEQAS